MQQPWQIPSIIAHSKLLQDSFLHWTKNFLVNKQLNQLGLAQALYESPRVILSHGTQADPIFNYANLAAQKLWGFSWEEFLKMPSRLSAEPIELADRNELFRKTNQYGFASDYTGVRITKEGRRFLIKDAVLWTVIDGAGIHYGHAVVFENWEFI